MVSEDVDAALAVEAAGAAAGAAALDEGAGVAVAALGASLPEAAFVAVCTGVAAGAALALALPPRKSVTYQPEPFNWNPAAVTCLVNVGAPHAGQTLSWGSDIF